MMDYSLPPVLSWPPLMRWMRGVLMAAAEMLGTSTLAGALPGAAGGASSATEADSLEELYRAHAPMVLRRARTFVGESEAEEVVHEVFLRLLERPDVLDGMHTPASWLYKVTTNHCINRMRNVRNRRSLVQRFVRRDEDDVATSPAEQVQARDQLIWLCKQLPEELVAIGLYYHLDGLTHAEIARIMGTSRRTIGNRLDEFEAKVSRLRKERR